VFLQTGRYIDLCDWFVCLGESINDSLDASPGFVHCGFDLVGGQLEAVLALVTQLKSKRDFDASSIVSPISTGARGEVFKE